MSRLSLVEFVDSSSAFKGMNHTLQLLLQRSIMWWACNFVFLQLFCKGFDIAIFLLIMQGGHDLNQTN